MTASFGTGRTGVSHRHLVGPAARWGLAARAFLYLLLGVLALSLATGHTSSETDQWGAMQQLNHREYGHALLWVVAIGLAGYSLWRFSEAAFGVAGDGRGAGPRFKSFARGVVYAFLAATAFTIVLGHTSTSQAGRQSSYTAQAMEHSGGRWAVAAVGAVVAAVGLVLVYEGMTRKFEKYLDLSSLTGSTRQAVTALGVAGTVARGVVFAVSGALVIDAAASFNPQKAAGIDQALRSMRDTVAGPYLLGLFAAGLIAFGLYGFAEARWRRT